MSKRKAIRYTDYTVLPHHLSKYLICQVCQKIMKQPVRLAPCAHTFCSGCVKHSTCPMCGKVHSKKQADMIAAGLIGQLLVRCNAEGCPFTGRLQVYMSQHKDKCQIRKCGGLRQWMQKIKKSMREMEQPSNNQPIIEISSRLDSNSEDIDIQSIAQSKQLNIEKNLCIISQEEGSIDLRDQQPQVKHSKNKKSSKANIFDISNEPDISYESRVIKNQYRKNFQPAIRNFINVYFKIPKHVQEMREQSKKQTQRVIEL